jgi:enoyl-CoA hydratase
VTGEVVLDRRGPVAVVTLSQPERRNAIDFAMYDRLEELWAEFAADRELRALVLRGAGGAFAGGTDIRHLQDIATGQQGADYEAHMRRVQAGMLDLRIPVVAVVEGACVGGGLVLAALSDLVLCTPDARFGSPIARTLGNTLSPTSIARLRQTFGPRRTAEMLLTGRLLDADEALAAGFVNAVVPPDALDAALAEMLERILACSPTTLWSIKEFERRLDAAAVEADDVYRVVYGGADFREGVAAFLEKRPAAFGPRTEPAP